MKSRIMLLLAIPLLAAVFSPEAVPAQPRLATSVLANGGTRGTNSTYVLDGTLGQAMVSRVSNSEFTLDAGFWPGLLSRTAGAVLWQTEIVMSDAGEDSGKVVFGQAIGAGDGLDPEFGEAELPPLPPSGILDIRFELPVSSQVASRRDFRSDTLSSATWSLRFQAGVGGYPVTLKWQPETLPAYQFTLKDGISGTLINVDMRRQNQVVVTNSAINYLVIEMSGKLSRTVSVAAGWNMLSVPVRADDPRAESLFPGAASPAYAFDNGYIIADTLEPGKGYWLKFGQGASYEIRGYEVLPKEIAVQGGWNMIGPFEEGVQVTHISSIPAGIVESEFFGFENGYRMASVLEVGKGYWVKTSRDGLLLVGNRGSSAGKMSALSLGGGLAEQLLPGAMVLHFTDTSTRSERALYLVDDAAVVMQALLPPAPPQGIFDVRFDGDTYAAAKGAEAQQIDLRGLGSSVIMHAEHLGDLVLRVTDAFGGDLFNRTLRDGGQVELPAGLEKLLVKTEEAVKLPSDFALYQNFPNPFNPTTVIKYALPAEAHVTISVFDVLGRKVLDLVDEKQAAGYHAITVEANDLGTGVFFYVMQAGNFREIKKMVLIR